MTREGQTEVEERQLYTQAIVGQVMCLMQFFGVYLLQLILPRKQFQYFSSQVFLNIAMSQESE